MGIPFISSFERIAKEDGRQEGIIEGVKEGMLKGIMAGKQKGMEEGALKTLRENIVQILKIRFGDVPPRITRITRIIDDAEILRELLAQAVICESLNEFATQLISTSAN